MIIYCCRKCKYEISWGAIKCPGCGTTDPKLEVVGVAPKSEATSQEEK